MIEYLWSICCFKDFERMFRLQEVWWTSGLFGIAKARNTSLAFAARQHATRICIWSSPSKQNHSDTITWCNDALDSRCTHQLFGRHEEWAVFKSTPLGQCVPTTNRNFCQHLRIPERSQSLVPQLGDLDSRRKSWEHPLWLYSLPNGAFKCNVQWSKLTIQRHVQLCAGTLPAAWLTECVDPFWVANGWSSQSSSSPAWTSHTPSSTIWARAGLAPRDLVDPGTQNA